MKDFIKQLLREEFIDKKTMVHTIDEMIVYLNRLKDKQSFTKDELDNVGKAYSDLNLVK
jgi:hypothetical protein